MKSELSESFDPAEPLRDDRYERFAQLRAIGVPCRTAAWEAGFRAKSDQPLRPGNAARLDRHPEIKARKVFLAGDDAEVVSATRLFVRDRLMRWATLDILNKFAIIETVECKKGDAVQKIPRIIGIDWKALRESEHASAIVGFKFDRETGIMTEFSSVRPDDAISQLRDMYGLRAPRKTELTGESGAPLQIERIERVILEHPSHQDGPGLPSAP